MERYMDTLILITLFGGLRLFGGIESFPEPVDVVAFPRQVIEIYYLYVHNQYVHSLQPAERKGSLQSKWSLLTEKEYLVLDDSKRNSFFFSLWHITLRGSFTRINKVCILECSIDANEILKNIPVS